MAPSSSSGPQVWWREPPPSERDQPVTPAPEPSLFEPAVPMNPNDALPVDATVEISAVPAAPAPGPIGAVPGPPGTRNSPPGTRNSPLAIAGIALTVIGLLLVTIVGVVALTSEGSGPTATDTVTEIPQDTISAVASSTQTADGGISYTADNTLDGDPVTAWNSKGDVHGIGPGITLTYTFSSPVDLRSITVLNGYQKVRTNRDGSTVDLYALNGRVHEFLVITAGGQWTWELRDDRQAQTLSEDFGTTSQVTLKVLSVYRSDKYRDLAISEMSFAAAG